MKFSDLSTEAKITAVFGYVPRSTYLKVKKLLSKDAKRKYSKPGIVIKEIKMSDVKAATIGATVGGASAIATVSATGVAGLGAIGITSGLAGIGAVVGGGMLTGLCLVTAAPLAVGGLGVGLYRLFK
jgi:hypothetical protein